MGSRSKFHKSNEATTPGRALLHVGARQAKDKKFKDPRRRKPTRMTFEMAFWEVFAERRQPDFVAPAPSPPQPDLGERAANRAEDRRLAAIYARQLFADQPRGEARRRGLAKAQLERRKLTQVKVETYQKQCAQYAKDSEARS